MLGAVYQGRGDYARRGRLPRAAYARLVVGLVIIGPAQPRRVHNDFAVAGGAAPAVAWQHFLRRFAILGPMTGLTGTLLYIHSPGAAFCTEVCV